MKLRPSMSNVVKMLTGKKDVDSEITKPGIIDDFMELKIRSMNKAADPMSSSGISPALGKSPLSSVNTTTALLKYALVRLRLRRKAVATSRGSRKQGSNDGERCNNKDGRGGWVALEEAATAALDLQAGRVSKTKGAVKAATGRGARKRATVRPLAVHCQGLAGGSGREARVEGNTVGCDRGARGWERWATIRMVTACVGKTIARSVVRSGEVAESSEGCSRGERQRAGRWRQWQGLGYQWLMRGDGGQEEKDAAGSGEGYGWESNEIGGKVAGSR
ncbi:hypothetical protein B296_00028498 [Ensete ventricosum]|uniref:Uncharacterized protein n=1 Tax=Ensete ventricosum TaxID=4639 RepID=A0A426XTG0_ENSVE|nr:hypothetical protein B296_00028498 [Ensete ventricosum]